MGDPDKDRLRERCWGALRDAGAGRFPGIEGRIPNFVGAEAAARRMTELEVWKRARVLKCNPDAPSRPVRKAALDQGKCVLMAVPKLADRCPFILLDPHELEPGQRWTASSIKGAGSLGRPLALEDVPPVDLIVTGCVGASRRGERLGKGGGYSDLEFGLLREVGRVSEDTPIVSVLHPSQLVRSGSIPVYEHDITLDWIVTPEETIRTRREYVRPSGIVWDLLDEEQLAAMPVLSNRSARASS